MKNFMAIDQQFRWNEQIIWKLQISKAHSQENVCSEKHCTIKENKFVVLKLHHERTPGPNGFTGDFSKHFMKK